MKREETKIVCPECEVLMNHHADKLVEPINAQDMAQMNPDLGGIVEEIHFCPACGKTEANRPRQQ